MLLKSFMFQKSSLKTILITLGFNKFQLIMGVF